MITSTHIRDSIQEGLSLEQVAEVYTELSVQKLQKIRGQIESNRQFVSDLTDVFHIVREAAVRQGIILAQKRGTLSILLTSNHPFYGNLETQLTRFYMAHSQISYGDLIVIGRTGGQFLQDFNFPMSFKPYIFSDDLPNISEITTLATSTIAYERVLLYHSRLQSIIIQRPAVTEISGTLSSNPLASKNFYYILEPETKKTLEFFDTQIVKLLLEQAFLEAELARTGARLILMDDSKTRAEAFIREQRKLLGLVEKAETNAKMLEISLATITRKYLTNENNW